jgi:hypothetical protein
MKKEMMRNFNRSDGYLSDRLRWCYVRPVGAVKQLEQIACYDCNMGLTPGAPTTSSLTLV